jgi:cytochrome P450
VETLSQAPTADTFVQNPYPFYAAARAAGPVVFWKEYDLPVATDHANVQTVLRDRRLGREPCVPAPFPSHLRAFERIERHSMLELEPPRHARLRGLVLRAFTSRRVAGLEDKIESLCHDLIDRFPTGRLDLLPCYARQVPVLVIARLLGVPDARANDLLGWSNAMVAMYQARRTRAIEDAAERASAAFAAFLSDLIEERRRKPADDLLSELAQAEADEDGLTREELVATCILLLNAGHEATVHTLGNGVRALVLAGQPPITPECVEEILRYDPPLHLFTRHVYEQVEIGGNILERGQKIGCLLASANRDATIWSQPDRFEPARPVRTNLSFGTGIHFCLGAPLARLELLVALRVLFARCPALALAETPRYADIYHFRGLEKLMVTC